MQMAGRRVGWGAAPRKRAVPPRPRPAGTGKARQGQGQDSGHEAPPRANVLSSALGVLQCPWVCNFWGQQADMKRICCCTVAKSCPTLCNPMDCVVRQAPLSMGFPRQDTHTHTAPRLYPPGENDKGRAHSHPGRSTDAPTPGHHPPMARRTWLVRAMPLDLPRVTVQGFPGA